MSAKQIIFGESARQRLLRGADALADAVAVTLGPRVASKASPPSGQEAESSGSG